MKIFKFLKENVFFAITLFLLAFIPLYPKLPIIYVKHTWVYVRLEDFFVFFSSLLFIGALIKRKINIKAPLTLPIFTFWIIGAISTFNAILFIFPHLVNTFPNIALLHLLRRVEYMSLFFVAYVSVKNERYISYVAFLLAATMLLVFFYGLGQRFLGFPAFLTMNEEFAKGIPLRLSAFARIPSTFAGHYDLAAYLVLLIPVVGSLIFGYKNIFIKIGLFLTVLAGLILLLMTASRVSFVTYLIGITFMLIMHKKKIYILPVIILSVLILNSFQGISQRFGSTISQADVVVDARTGKPIGIVKEEASQLSAVTKSKTAIPEKAAKSVIIEDTQSTGENLPQGTGFINIPQEPTTKTVTQVLYKKSKIKDGTTSTEITTMEGDFVVKKALAYDVSFTTRFQGEWPRALAAFYRNIFLGSGYSSTSLATDNDYLRMLGETGLLGLLFFFSIFLIAGLYISKVMANIDSPRVKSFVLGVSAGVIGLSANALLIDVFEASKVAFVLWLLIGLAFGFLRLYQKKPFKLLEELTSAFMSVPAFIIYYTIIAFLIFSSSFNNYFVGDDFTWLRWAGDCKKVLYTSGLTKCEPIKSTIEGYFLNANGFFYRPGAKLYFFIMYAIFWLNSQAYHIVSVLFHILNSILIFLIALKIFKNKLLSFLSGLFFLVLSVHSEVIFWISSVGHLVASSFILAGLLLFIAWKEKKNLLFLLLSLLSVVLGLLFQELGMIAPFLIIAYDLILEGKPWFKKISYGWYYLLYILIVPLYLALRYYSQALWFSGDYSYSLVHLPFNILGNIFGYFGISLFGSSFLFYYDLVRSFGRLHFMVAVALGVLIALIIFLAISRLYRKLSKADFKIICFSLVFFVTPLMIFLGLGNIALRYAYLSSAGAVFLLVFLIKKVYGYLFVKNKKFALPMALLIVILLIIYQLLQLKKANYDWHVSGARVNRLLADFNSNFVIARATPQNPVFYFVNTPIRYGEAWIFPVGLKDALWFTFQNENLTVNEAKSLDMALDAAEGSASAKVFEFSGNNSISEVTRTKSTITVPVK